MNGFLVFACTVCFGDPASPGSRGIMAGVLLLLAVVIGVLGGIAYTAALWARRAKQLESGSLR